MRNFKVFFNQVLIATVCLLLFGCKKSIEEKQPESLTAKKSSSLSSMLTPPDVYVAGSEGGVAKYWLNGTGVTLTGGEQATGIFIDGSDVHVCGWGTDPVTFNFVAKYWLNGVLTDLSDGTNSEIAFGITVSGGDVYISGRVGVWVPTAVCWINGTQTTLGSGQAMGISADPNGNVYVPNADFGAPSYWVVGGSQVNITGAPSNTVLYAVAANSTGDVYAVGYDAMGASEDALLFKNGVQQTMMLSGETRAMNVAINSSGNPIIAGLRGSTVSNQQISFWDNPLSLNIIATGRFVASMTGVAVDPVTDDVYLCGSEFDPNPPAKAKYWMITPLGSVTGPVSLGNPATNCTALAIAVDY